MQRAAWSCAAVLIVKTTRLLEQDKVEISAWSLYQKDLSHREYYSVYLFKQNVKRIQSFVRDFMIIIAGVRAVMCKMSISVLVGI